MLETLETVFVTVGIVVTAATSIVAGLEQLANITPTTKDDYVVSKLKVGLSYTSTILDKVSVWNLKK